MSSPYSDRRAELEAFKALNLSVIASDFGYQIVPKKSTRRSVLMEAGGDRIIISRDSGGHYVFCSVHSDAKGSIIDFIQQKIEKGCSLGQVRQILRPYLDSSVFISVQQKHASKSAKTIKPSSLDLAAVAARYSAFEPITEYHPYLCGQRHIPLKLLLSPRLKGRVRHDARRGSVVFPHWGSPDEQSDTNDRCLTGYEIKGEGLTMFSSGGKKGLWMSAGFKHDRVLAFAESGIDALSYLAINNALGDIRIASLSGRMSGFQSELVKSALGRMRKGAVVVAAFDNDKAGDQLVNELAQLVDLSGRNDLVFEDNRPPQRGHDWNQVRKQSSGPEIESPGIG